MCRGVSGTVANSMIKLHALKDCCDYLLVVSSSNITTQPLAERLVVRCLMLHAQNSSLVQSYIQCHPISPTPPSLPSPSSSPCDHLHSSAYPSLLSASTSGPIHGRPYHPRPYHPASHPDHSSHCRGHPCVGGSHCHHCGCHYVHEVQVCVCMCACVCVCACVSVHTS